MIGLLKRAIVPLTAAAVLLLGVIFLPWGRPLAVLVAVTVLVISLGLYDWNQTRWSVTRNYPVAGWIRWLANVLRPFLRAYIVEGDLEGAPYNYEARALIRARAWGRTDTHPYGTERDVASQEYHWIQHSMAPHCVFRRRRTVGPVMADTVGA